MRTLSYCLHASCQSFEYPSSRFRFFNSTLQGQGEAQYIVVSTILKLLEWMPQRALFWIIIERERLLGYPLLFACWRLIKHVDTKTNSYRWQVLSFFTKHLSTNSTIINNSRQILRLSDHHHHHHHHLYLLDKTPKDPVLARLPSGDFLCHCIDDGMVNFGKFKQVMHDDPFTFHSDRNKEMTIWK